MSSERDAARLAAQLTAALRREGLRIGIDRTNAFVEGAARSGDLYWAGRLTLPGRAEDIPVYDRVFYGIVGDPPPAASEERVLEGGAGAEGDTPPGEQRATEQEASQVERLRRTRFEALTDAELQELARAIEAIRRRAVARRVRRRRPDRAAGRFDLRRTAREMHRLDGELALPRFTRATVRVQPLTFLVDVSGSMTVAARGLLLAAASFVRSDAAHEAFTFGTRLTRVTPALRGPTIMRAIDAAADLARDRDGGTRIGESLRQLLERHGQSRAVRGAVVVIYSDGLERGEPEQLGHEMERLALRARRILWLNPLSASPQYQPLARGMRAALPHLDAFAAGHDLASFDAAVEGVLQRLAPGERARAWRPPSE